MMVWFMWTVWLTEYDSSAFSRFTMIFVASVRQVIVLQERPYVLMLS